MAFSVLASSAIRAACRSSYPEQGQFIVTQHNPSPIVVTTNTTQSQYPPGPNQYTQGPPQYIPGPPQYTPGPPQYAPGPPQYAPNPQGTPPYIQSGQQQSSNVTVVNSQPSAVESIIVVRSTRDHYLTLSIIMFIVTFLCIGCGWLPLLCAISAMIVSISARDDERGGQIVTAKKKATVSLSLNIIAGIALVAMIAATIGIFAFLRTTSESYPTISEHHPTGTTPTYHLPTGTTHTYHLPTGTTPTYHLPTGTTPTYHLPTGTTTTCSYYWNGNYYYYSC